MNADNFDTIVMFVIGGTFCLFLVGAMLAYIRQARYELIRDGHDTGLRAEINSLLLTRAALDKDYQSGRISENDYAATCLDIDRRFLAMSQQAPHSHKKGDAAYELNRAGIWLVIALPVCVSLIYASLGRPDLADSPLANRAAEIASQNQIITTTQQDLAQNLTDAKAASVAAPNNVDSWLNLAKAAATVNDSDTEIRALHMARQFTNDDPAILSLLAEALSRAADGQITVPARALIDKVLAADPNDPRSLFLWGLAAFQDGDYQNAITRWQSLLLISRLDSPWLPIVHSNIQKAAKAGNITLESNAGPDVDSIAAAADMSPEDREEMILSMVNNLRSRLKTTPDDTEGWLRLARAFDILGNTSAAFDALADAAKSDPQNLVLSYQFLERTIGIEMSSDQLGKAQTVINKLADDGADSPQYLFFAGHLARLSGDNDTAHASWTKLLETMPAKSEMAIALASEIAKLN